MTLGEQSVGGMHGDKLNVRWTYMGKERGVQGTEQRRDENRKGEAQTTVKRDTSSANLDDKNCL